MQTAIAAANAKLQVLSECNPAQSSHVVVKARMNEYLDAHMHADKNKVLTCDMENVQSAQHRSGTNDYLNRSNEPNANQNSVSDIGGLLNIMQKQNMIAELFVKQHTVATLPPLSIPVYSGDPLEFDFFIKAFEHGIEERIKSNKDRLYFLKQFTSGRPKVLVRSCQHMHPDRGYVEAKKLLHKYFGNEYTAYIDKALKWH